MHDMMTSPEVASLCHPCTPAFKETSMVKKNRVSSKARTSPCNVGNGMMSLLSDLIILGNGEHTSEIGGSPNLAGEW